MLKEIAERRKKQRRDFLQGLLAGLIVSGVLALIMLTAFFILF